MKRCLLALLLTSLFSGCVTQYYDAQGKPIPPPKSVSKAQEDSTRDTKDLSPEGLLANGLDAIATDNHGNVYVANFLEPNSIGIIPPGKQGRVLVTLPSSTASGLRFNKAGEMLIADSQGRAVLKLTPAASQLTVLGQNPQMGRLNDLAITDSGIIFASDTDLANNTGQIWRITPDGTATLMDSRMGATNGIEVSPKNDILYVNESNNRTIWAYDLAPEGNLFNKRPIIQFPTASVDGMRCDEEGNLYIARFNAGTIAVVSPAGKLIKEVRLKGVRPTNLTFGGPDGKTVYVTVQDRGAVEYFQNDIAGARWGNKL